MPISPKAPTFGAGAINRQHGHREKVRSLRVLYNRTLTQLRPFFLATNSAISARFTIEL